MYRLPDITEPLDFPDDFVTTPDGLLAAGGNLRPETIVNAYAKGIFPWYSRGDPILWWHPDPRLVLFPERVRVTTKMRKLLRKEGGDFTVTFNRAFERVIRECAAKRGPGRDDTWILPEIEASYTELFNRGFAQSVEVWDPSGKMTGGIYGVSLGRVFFGESMFSHVVNASKIALIRLCRELAGKGYGMMDCQVRTDHLLSMGAEEIPRVEFLEKLRSGEAGNKSPGARLGP